MIPKTTAVRRITILALFVITLLTGCGSGSGSMAGSPLTNGVTAPAPAPAAGQLVVKLTFPAVAKTASAASSFAQTASVIVHVLDQATHQEVVPLAIAQRPDGASTLDVTVPNVPAGTFDVYV